MKVDFLPESLVVWVKIGFGHAKPSFTLLQWPMGSRDTHNSVVLAVTHMKIVAAKIAKFAKKITHVPMCACYMLCVAYVAIVGHWEEGDVYYVMW